MKAPNLPDYNRRTAVGEKIPEAAPMKLVVPLPIGGIASQQTAIHAPANRRKVGWVIVSVREAAGQK
jgi:hypothetical protein